ncbi:hypothetical protein CTAYLR_009238 [Chrysophaeum taylorii]|uniref:EF-hand domain-containing protein n=1 Tax=Chrysophaeum taylorii TaxID=2483200 RepID=A0AAD7UKM4_9STRA|nr:hypothetical protein CTAYLR_009238 [Chrysophaeum taylorii]
MGGGALDEVLGEYARGGKITAGDVRWVMWDLGRHLLAEEEAEALVELDGTGAGVIDVETMVAWISRREEAWARWCGEDSTVRLVVRAARVFRECDEAMDGEISAREFTRVHQRLAEVGLVQQGFLTCLKEVDREGDGVIEFNEFAAWIVRRSRQHEEAPPSPLPLAGPRTPPPRSSPWLEDAAGLGECPRDVAGLQEAVRLAAAAAAAATEELAELDREYGSAARDADVALAACGDADAATSRREGEVVRAEARLAEARDEIEAATGSVESARKITAATSPGASAGGLSLFYSHTPVAVSQAVIEAADELRLLQDEANDHKICEACDEALAEGHVFGAVGSLDLSTCSARGLAGALELAARLGGAKTPRAAWLVAAAAEAKTVREALVAGPTTWGTRALDPLRLRDAAARLDAEAIRLRGDGDLAPWYASTGIAKELGLVAATAEARAAASSLRAAVVAQPVTGSPGALDVRSARAGLAALEDALGASDALREPTPHVSALADAARAALRLREAACAAVDADAQQQHDDSAALARSDSVGSQLSSLSVQSAPARHLAAAAAAHRAAAALRTPGLDEGGPLFEELEDDGSTVAPLDDGAGSVAPRRLGRAYKGGVDKGAALSALSAAVAVLASLLDAPLHGGGDDDGAGDAEDSTTASLLGQEKALVEADLHDRIIARDVPLALADGRTAGRPGPGLRVAANDATLAALRAATAHAREWAVRCGTSRAKELLERAELLLACRDAASEEDWEAVDAALSGVATFTVSHSPSSSSSSPRHAASKLQHAKALAAAGAEVELLRLEVNDRKMRCAAYDALATGRVVGVAGAIDVDTSPCSPADLNAAHVFATEELGGPQTAEARRVYATVGIVARARSALAECEGYFCDEWDSNEALFPETLRPCYDAIVAVSRERHPTQPELAAALLDKEGGAELAIVLRTAEARRVAKALRAALSSDESVAKGPLDALDLAGARASIEAIETALADFDRLEVPTPHTSALAALCAEVKALRLACFEAFDDSENESDDDENEKNDDNDDGGGGGEKKGFESIVEAEAERDAALEAAIRGLRDTLDCKLRSEGDDNVVRHADASETRGDVVGAEVDRIELAFHERLISRDLPRSLRAGRVFGELGALSVDIAKIDRLERDAQHARAWAGRCGTRGSLELLSTAQLVLACRAALADNDWAGLAAALHGPDGAAAAAARREDAPFVRFCAWAPHAVSRAAIDAADELRLLRDAVDDYEISTAAATALANHRVGGRVGALDVSGTDAKPLDAAISLAASRGGGKTARAKWLLDAAAEVRGARSALASGAQAEGSPWTTREALGAARLARSIAALAERQPDIAQNERELAFDELELVRRTAEARECATTLREAVGHDAHRPGGRVGELDVAGCEKSIPALREALKQAQRLAAPTPHTTALAETAKATLHLREALVRRADTSTDDDLDTDLATAVASAKDMLLKPLHAGGDDDAADGTHREVGHLLDAELGTAERELHDRRIARNVGRALAHGRCEGAPADVAVTANEASLAALDAAHAHAHEWASTCATPRAAALRAAAKVVLACRRAAVAGDWDGVAEELARAEPEASSLGGHHVPKEAAEELALMRREVDDRAIVLETVDALAPGHAISGAIGALDVSRCDAAVLEACLRAAKPRLANAQASPRVERLLYACAELAPRRKLLDRGSTAEQRRAAWATAPALRPANLRASLVALQLLAQRGGADSVEGAAELKLLFETADARAACVALRESVENSKRATRGTVGAIDVRGAVEGLEAVDAALERAARKQRAGVSTARLEALVAVAKATARARRAVAAVVELGDDAYSDQAMTELQEAVAEARGVDLAAAATGGADDDGGARSLVGAELDLVETELHERRSRRALVNATKPGRTRGRVGALHVGGGGDDDESAAAEAIGHARTWEARGAWSPVARELRATVELVFACRRAARERRWADVSRALDSGGDSCLCLAPASDAFVRLVGSAPPAAARFLVDAGDELATLKAQVADDAICRACRAALGAARVAGDVGALDLAACDPAPLRQALDLGAKLGGAQSPKAAWLLATAAEVEACRAALRCAVVDWGSQTLSPARLAHVLHDEMGYPAAATALWGSPLDESLGFAELFLVLHTARARAVAGALVAAVCDDKYRVVGTPGATELRGAAASLPALRAAVGDAEALLAPTPHTAALAEAARAALRVRESLVDASSSSSKDADNDDGGDELAGGGGGDDEVVLERLLLADNAEVATAIAAAKTLLDAPLFAGDDDDDAESRRRRFGHAPSTVKELLGAELALVEAEYNDRRISREVPRALGQGRCAGRAGAVVVGANAATLVTLEIATLHAREWAPRCGSAAAQEWTRTAELVLACRSAAVEGDWDAVAAALDAARRRENATSAKAAPLGPGAPPSASPRAAVSVVGPELHLLQDEVNDRSIMVALTRALDAGAVEGSVGALDATRADAGPLDRALDLAAELGGAKTSTTDRLVKTAAAVARCRAALATGDAAWESSVALSRPSLRARVDELDALEAVSSGPSRSSGDESGVASAAAELRLVLRTADARAVAAALRGAVSDEGRRVSGFPGAIDARGAAASIPLLDDALDAVRHLEVATPHVEALARCARLARACRAALVRATENNQDDDDDDDDDIELVAALAAANDELEAPLHGGGDDDATRTHNDTIASLLGDELGLVEAEVHDRRVSRDIPRALSAGRCAGAPGAIEVETNEALRELELERATTHARAWVWRCATHTSAELLAAGELVLACRRAAARGDWRGYDEACTVDAILAAKRQRDNAHRAASSLGSSDALLGPGQPPVVSAMVPLAAAEISLLQDEVNDRAIVDAAADALVGASRVRGRVGALDLSRVSPEPLDAAMDLAAKLGGAKTQRAKRLLATAAILAECRAALLARRDAWDGPLDPDRLATALADLERAPENRKLTGVAELRLISDTAEARAACSALRAAVSLPKHRVSGTCGLVDVRGAADSRAPLAAALARFAGLSTPTPHAEALAKVADACLRYRAALVRLVDAGPDAYAETLVSDLASALGAAKALYALDLRSAGDDDATTKAGGGPSTAASLLQTEVDLAERELHDRKIAHDIPKALAEGRCSGRLGAVRVSTDASHALQDLHHAVKHAREWAPKCNTPHASELLATAELALACRAAAAKQDWRTVDLALHNASDANSASSAATLPLAALGLLAPRAPDDLTSTLRDASRHKTTLAAKSQDAIAHDKLKRAEAALADAKAARERVAAASASASKTKADLDKEYKDKLARTQQALRPVPCDEAARWAPSMPPSLLNATTVVFRSSGCGLWGVVLRFVGMPLEKVALFANSSQVSGSNQLAQAVRLTFRDGAWGPYRVVGGSSLVAWFLQYSCMSFVFQAADRALSLATGLDRVVYGDAVYDDPTTREPLSKALKDAAAAVVAGAVESAVSNRAEVQRYYGLNNRFDYGAFGPALAPSVARNAIMAYSAFVATPVAYAWFWPRQAKDSTSFFAFGLALNCFFGNAIAVTMQALWGHSLDALATNRKHPAYLDVLRDGLRRDGPAAFFSPAKWGSRILMNAPAEGTLAWFYNRILPIAEPSVLRAADDLYTTFVVSAARKQ